MEVIKSSKENSGLLFLEETNNNGQIRLEQQVHMTADAHNTTIKTSRENPNTITLTSKEVSKTNDRVVVIFIKTSKEVHIIKEQTKIPIDSKIKIKDREEVNKIMSRGNQRVPTGRNKYYMNLDKCPRRC